MVYNYFILVLNIKLAFKNPHGVIFSFHKNLSILHEFVYLYATGIHLECGQLEFKSVIHKSPQLNSVRRLYQYYIMLTIQYSS